MKTKLLFLFIVLLSFQVKAQWVAQSDRLLTGEVYSIKMRGDTVYLLSGWAFYTSTDRGKTFSEIDLGQDKNIQDEFIRHIAIDSKGNAYILFYKYKQGPTEIDSTKILVSSDAFKTYKEIYRIKGYPKCKIIVSPSDSILFIYNKTYNEYSTLISSDYGKTWKEYSNNIWSDYDHLYLKRIGNKLFTWTYSGEDDCRHIYVSTDNGKTYSAFGKPIPFGSIECLNINSKNSRGI